MSQPDLVVRRGVVVDGTGAPARVADVAVTDGRVQTVGVVDVTGRVEVDAAGAFVTPGFVDAHTHLDAQLWWDPSGSPAAGHGVTSVVIGNCGVTFAPVRRGDEAYLASMMESVEDIPADAILDGLPWSWETYGDFLAALGERSLGVNVSGLVGHCALRSYAMGDRSLDADATPDDLACMTDLVREALDRGAIGVSTSRTRLHRLPDGRPVPGTFASADELHALAAVMRAHGSGVLGAVTRLHEETGETIDDTLAEIDLLGDIALESGRPVTFNLTQGHVPGLHTRILERVHHHRERGARLWPQTTVRPIAWLYGICHRTPFDRAPAWRALRDLPLADRLATLRDATARQDLVDDSLRHPPRVDLSKVYAFPPGPARYDLSEEDSLAAHARRRGVPPAAAFVDMALESDGAQVYTWPVFNDDPQAVREMLADPAVMLGLADAGAHVGQIMDASQPTHVLTHWVRDARLMPVEEAVRRLTSHPSGVFELADRGVLAPGAVADINVIDLTELRLDVPRFVHDGPNGAGRFVQDAHGYRWTFVGGVPVVADGVPTGAAPGQVVRASSASGTSR
ncbi:MAG: amidohydrolase family protein [Ilumatobacteraceae bacterium]